MRKWVNSDTTAVEFVNANTKAAWLEIRGKVGKGQEKEYWITAENTNDWLEVVGEIERLSIKELEYHFTTGKLKLFCVSC